jgi:exopolysaccharide biosynthesis operon protein EpsL
LLAAAPAAPAFWNDRLEVYASENITYDSNVFRLPDSVVPAGFDGRSDRYLVHTLGVNADIPVSLQRFQASYSKFWTRYRRFDHLDFDGHNGSARWLWVLTDPRLDGDVGYTETIGLASFATFGGTTADVMKTRQAFASANWQVTPRWIAHAGIMGTERTHGDPARSIHDIESKSGELRLSYVTPAENRIGVGLRAEDGNAPSENIVDGEVFDNAYRQFGVGIVGRWTVTGHSRLDGRVEYVKREYDQFQERNYSGPAWGVTHTWTPTGKLTIVTTLRRDIAPLDDIQTAFVTSTGASVRPRWDVTPKFAVVGHADFARWKYKADPAHGGEYHHDIRAFGLGFAWTPFQRVVITGNAQREVRDSSLGDADYGVNVYTLDARIGF